MKYLAFSLPVLAVIFVTIESVNRDAVVDISRQALVQTVGAGRDYLRLHDEVVLHQCRDLASQKLLRSGLLNEDRPTLMSALSSFAGKASFVEVLSADGRILARRASNTRGGFIPPARVKGERPPSSKAASSIDYVVNRGRVYRVVHVPVVESGHLLGALRVGYVWDRAFCEQFGDVTATGVVLLRGGRIVDSNLPGATQRALQETLHGAAIDQMATVAGTGGLWKHGDAREVVLPEGSFMSAEVNLVEGSPPLSILFLRSLDASAGLARMGRVLALSAALALLLIVMNSLVVLRAMRSLLGRLLAAVQPSGVLAATSPAPCVRRSIEAEVELFEERYDAARRTWEDMFNSIRDALFLLDGNGSILTINTSARGLATEALQDPQILLHDLLAGEPTPGSEGSSARPREREVLLDRLQKHLVVAVAPLLSQTGAVRGSIVTVRDVTESRRAEEALSQSIEQLRQLQKTEAVSRLAGGVAHDFNNMLAAVVGFSELLLQSTDKDSRQHAYAQQIRNAGERATALTRQLLAFSRKHRVEPKPVDLNACVGNMNKILKRLIGEHIDVITRPGSDLGHIVADEGQIEQILLNLVVNARDAMPGGGKITIETAAVEGDVSATGPSPASPSNTGTSKTGSYVALTVTDTGCGMDSDTLARIFEPFFSTKEEGKGTGLGLSTVNGIVHQYGGDIHVSSEPGKGTSFRICFPSIPAGPAARPERRDVVLQLPVRGKETILVVDDEDVVRSVACETLRREGYRILQARNGQEALEMYGGPGEVYQLVLTDVVMPGMSGPDFWLQLRLRRPDVKVTFMSGYTDGVPARPELICAPMLWKPFTPAELLSVVRAVLDDRVVGAPVGQQPQLFQPCLSRAN